MSETLPAPKDRAHARPGLPAQPDAAECGDDRRVAHLLLGTVQDLIGSGKGLARIPEHRPIAEESDRRLTAVVAVVLVDEQIDGRLTEGNVVGGIIVPPQRRRIHAERMLGILRIALGQHQPRLDEVLFDNDTIVPSTVGRPGVRCGIDELAIDHRSREYPANVTRATEHQDRSPSWHHEIVMFDDEAAFVQELDIGERPILAGVAFVEQAPVPPHGCRVEELLVED